ncbi:MAG TPA: rod shape-determining protein RodA [Stellaceae bacterium]|nr:rod shape-determining protein RodA [Stellaceae bacterium]
MSLYFGERQRQLTLADKLRSVSWGLMLLLCVIGAIGCAVLYSAANGNMQPWAMASMIRFSVSLVMLLVVAVVDIKFWYRASYPLYILGLILLVLVDFKGTRGLGAQRWLTLGPLSLQPSEIMKIGLIMALARYFSARKLEEVGRFVYLLPPMMMVALPAALVMKQPDLGTAMMLGMSATCMFFIAGVRIWVFAVGFMGLAGMVPIAWRFMKAYQKQRILTFLNPQADSLGAGYHLMQSEIALGSGGFWGKGFLQGTQSHLDFLPEKQTDFIFTMFAEEFGMVGGLVLLALYALVIIYGFAIGLRSRNQYGKLLALGLACNLFLYVFINIAMVMGVLPVVGVPLPLISYGGTAMLTLMFGFGLMISVYIHRDTRLNRRGESEG